MEERGHSPDPADQRRREVPGRWPEGRATAATAGVGWEERTHAGGERGSCPNSPCGPSTYPTHTAAVPPSRGRQCRCHRQCRCEGTGSAAETAHSPKTLETLQSFSVWR
jgi:hypothetical protein